MKRTYRTIAFITTICLLMSSLSILSFADETKLFALKPEGVNIVSYGKEVTTSTRNLEGNLAKPEYINDSDITSRWASLGPGVGTGSNVEWAYINLKEKYPINYIYVKFGRGFESTNVIEVSNDAQNWTQVASGVGSKNEYLQDGGKITVKNYVDGKLTDVVLNTKDMGVALATPVEAQYVRIKTGPWVYITEFQIFSTKKPSSGNEIIAGDYITEKWKSVELNFESDKVYSNALMDAELNVTFTSPSGKVYVMPGFWDGDNKWRARFAPPEVGEWSYKTSCTDSTNQGLNNKTGNIFVDEYTGSCDIYKKGFVQSQKGKKYFTYADGTPFFYIGDTHWTLPKEKFDSSDVEGIDSQFKYIVDKRVEQGFTVYQSQPLDALYTLNDGVSNSDLAAFRDLDRKYQYVAEKGLVHANSQFFFTPLINNAAFTPELLDKLSRLWVARYGSYPVMWTTSQECDNDYYYELGHQTVFTAETNPWKKVAASMNKYDPYKNPITAHQEYASRGSVGVNASNSAFRDIMGHSWYGAQWKTEKIKQQDYLLLKDFWNNSQGKPVINYESCYENLETKEFGARQQGWLSFLNGMFGHGYGAIDIWYVDSNYGVNAPTQSGDETVTIQDKSMNWDQSVNLPAATQLATHMKTFLTSIKWWEMVPRFDDGKWAYMNDGVLYSHASIENSDFITYFYNKTRATGLLLNLTSELYDAYWFNPRTGEKQFISAVKPNSDHTWNIPEKPDEKDWVLYVTDEKYRGGGTNIGDENSSYPSENQGPATGEKKNFMFVLVGMIVSGWGIFALKNKGEIRFHTGK